MSTDFSIRPVGAPAATPVVQPSGDAAHKAVATELPASKSVTAADGSVSVRADPETASDYVSHQVVDRYIRGLARNAQSGGFVVGRQDAHDVSHEALR